MSLRLESRKTNSYYTRHDCAANIKSSKEHEDNSMPVWMGLAVIIFTVLSSVALVAFSGWLATF